MVDKNLILLPIKFEGTGEVKGYNFTQIHKTEKYYIYEINSEDNTTHYEVILRLSNPVCIDFDKRIYSDTDYKEYYPKSSKFGTYGWCFTKTGPEEVKKWANENL